MTRQTSSATDLYQQTPILIDTLAEYVQTDREDVLDLLVWEASAEVGGSDEAALLQVINDHIIH